MTTPADEILEMLHRIAPDVDPTSVERARPLAEQLDLDSIDYQNLLVAISTRYAIEIPAVDVSELRSIDDLTRYVSSHARSRRST